MARTRPTASLFGSPVLIGALTVLIVIVAVFLAYNANQGLPFVPTYDLKAQVPSAANLVPGNEVRIGGHRVGAVDSIRPVRHPGGTTTAILSMKLDKSVQPLPIDSTILIRSRSALGLKYVQLTPGTSRVGFRAGDTMSLTQATPRPVELDEVLNTFDLRTREGIRNGLVGFGNGLAGRGQDVNAVIQELPSLFSNLQPVAQNLASSRTDLKGLFPALERTARIVAPVAGIQAQLFVNLDTTFKALASVAPSIQSTIANTPPTLASGIAGFPVQRAFIENTTAFARELRPGVAVLPSTLPDLADALQFGIPALQQSPQLNAELTKVFRALRRFADDPNVTLGVRRLTDTVNYLYPTLHFLAPTQTVCNYVTLWFRNISSLLSEGDKNGTWQRFIIVATPTGPNSESGPSSAPANGGGVNNFLHANTYPNSAAPGQNPRECAAGNENFYANRKVIGNPPGNTGTKTDGQVPGQR